MPKAPRKICSHSGCFAIALEGSRFCARHKAQGEKARTQFFQKRSSNKLGYTYTWQKARAAFLREHPLCEQCLKEGRTTAASVVDHIVPHKGDMTIFWDRSNWQSLCDSCHSVKTAKEDGGFGNKPKR